MQCNNEHIQTWLNRHTYRINSILNTYKPLQRDIFGKKAKDYSNIDADNPINTITMEEQQLYYGFNREDISLF